MLGKLTSNHFNDVNGNPGGGTTFGEGFTIAWQNGPLGRGKDRAAQNGAFVETIIKAAADRIEYYQDSRFKCEENAAALHHLNKAIEVLQSRTKSRKTQGVEGTHAVHDSFPSRPSSLGGEG